MASSLSQEEENYVRMCLLMTGISTRAVRIVFDHEMAPSCLKSTLNKKYNILKKLRDEGKIKPIQWNLLFRNKPDVPDSKTFDVTLMITLLRHLTDLTPPGGYDCLPSANETTPLSDLARIKYYRNFLAHLVEEKIEDAEFLTAWDIVTDAISRLGGLTMKQECDNLKVKILDQSNQEIIELKEAIKSLKKVNEDTTIDVKKLKRSHEDTAIEVKKLKTSHEDTVPWNIRAQINEILVEWKDNEKMFISTRAAKHVLKCIKENSCVTITASSGVGKTTTLKHVALQMELEGYDVLPVTDPGDIVKFYNPTKKTLFVIDDLYGNYSLKQTDIKDWEPFIERIKKILSKKLSKIIVACRLQVYQDDKFEPVFNSCVCNLLSESMCLSKAEKKSIAEFYLKTKAPEVIEYYDLYDCFPLLCKLYNANPALNITDFFQNPFTVYEAEIDKLRKKECFSKYCALALCVIFNNNLNEDILTEDVNEETRAIIENTCEACRLDRGTSRLTLLDDLNSLIHTFLKKEQNIYKAIHEKIFDFLVYYFGKKAIRCLIKNAHSGLISERFFLERQNNIDQFITIVPPEYHQMYILRMIEDWSKGKVNDVFCNINMEIPQFRKKFHFRLNELDISYQRQLAHTYDVENKDTALLMSCFEGDIPMIVWCFKHDVDVNQCRNDETTPLYVAASEGWTEIVRMLLDIGADCNKCDNNGCSPLMIACSDVQTERVKMLIDKGADYNGCNNDGRSPITRACSNRHTEIVRMLLDKGADYNKCNNDGRSPIMGACSEGHTEIVKLLIDKGADYNKCDDNGWSPVLMACSEGHTEIVKMLLDKGADYKSDDDGWSSVMRACIYGQTDIVRMLLDNGADYNKCDNDGLSPVMRACSERHTEIVKMLLDKGADYNKCDNNGMSHIGRACSNVTCDNDGWSPGMRGCSEGQIEIVKMLLEKGADCNKCDKYGWSPVMTACFEGHTEIVRMLLDKGADYNKCDKDDMSPIVRACSDGHIEIVEMLLDKGADYNECHKDSWSPVMCACNGGHIEIVRLLLDKGADFNKCDNDGWSSLMFACCGGQTKMVKFLLDKGANWKTCNNYGESALMIASERGYRDIVNVINEHSKNEIDP